MTKKQTRVRKVPIKTLDEVLKARGEFIDEYKQAMADKLQQNRTRKLKIKSIKSHSNLANEIQSLEKSDKFLDRIFYTGCVILAILAITLIIVNIK